MGTKKENILNYVIPFILFYGGLLFTFAFDHVLINTFCLVPFYFYILKDLVFNENNVNIKVCSFNVVISFISLLLICFFCYEIESISFLKDMQFYFFVGCIVSLIVTFFSLLHLAILDN